MPSRLLDAAPADVAAVLYVVAIAVPSAGIWVFMGYHMSM
jgi:hypothetical protein